MGIGIAVLGATGRTGRLVVEAVEAAADLSLAAAVARPSPGCFADADVVVDFSAPGALVQALPLLTTQALVSGTTGLDAAALAALDARARLGPVLHAANFSVGVNLLLALVARAAVALPDADIEIVEAHHRHKRDAPSGTALALGRAAAEARGQRLEDVAVHGRRGDTGARPGSQIGLHALRGGEVAGEHQVWFLSAAERVTLAHATSSRQVFADGAVRAARWIAGRGAGRYTMAEVLGGMG